jgi:hypothetical protein
MGQLDVRPRGIIETWRFCSCRRIEGKFPVEIKTLMQAFRSGSRYGTEGQDCSNKPSFLHGVTDLVPSKIGKTEKKHYL